jgi:hypothetical protein
VTVQGVRYVHHERGLTVAQVGMITGAPPNVVRNWIFRKRITRNRWGRVAPEDLARYLATRGTLGQRRNARRYGFDADSCV